MPAILIDADACPVVNETIRIAKQHGFRCILICDTAHEECTMKAPKQLLFQRSRCGRFCTCQSCSKK